MQRCEACGGEFAARVRVDGKYFDFHGRKHCVDCWPYRRLRAPRKAVERSSKRLNCRRCGRSFAALQFIDGKIRSLYRRRFCLDCSPFGLHNTSKAPVIATTTEARALAKKARRTAQFARYRRARRRLRKNKLIADAGGRCLDCGYAVTPAALEFHHRDPGTKEFTLAEFGGPAGDLEAEAKKCDLVCANCHRLRHLTAAASANPNAVARRRMKARAVALFGDRCGGCAKEFPFAVFEFHHRDASQKEFGVATGGLARSWKRLLPELLKCVMLCANCHRETHAGLREIAAERFGREVAA